MTVTDVGITTVMCAQSVLVYGADASTNYAKFDNGNDHIAADVDACEHRIRSSHELCQASRAEALCTAAI
jgi:hypothetical protein